MTAVLGIGSAIYGAGYVTQKQSIANGPWMTNPDIGSEQANPYIRAYVALHGLFALNREEAIYFTAATDNEGEKLTTNCSYTVSGKKLDARWWTITAYGRDDFLIDNSEDKYALSMSELGNQTFSFTVSRKRADGHWLPLDGKGRFSLTLRLYNPEEAALKSPGTISMPSIRKRSCS